MKNEKLVTDSEIKKLSEIIARGAINAAAKYAKYNQSATVQDVSAVMAMVIADTLQYTGFIGK